MCICGRILLLQGDKVNIVKVKIRVYSTWRSLPFKYVAWLYLKECRETNGFNLWENTFPIQKALKIVKVC